MAVRFDPFLNRAIAYAIAEKLISTTDGNHVRIEPLGEKLVSEIEESGSFLEEIVFLKGVGRAVTEAIASRLFRIGT